MGDKTKKVLSDLQATSDAIRELHITMQVMSHPTYMRGRVRKQLEQEGVIENDKKKEQQNSGG